MKAASNDPMLRTDKSSYRDKPHLVQPKGKSKKYLECDCRLFDWYKVCQHTLAVSVDLGMCLVFLNEVKSKILQGKRSLTAVVNSNRKLTERGMKLNEIAKTATERSNDSRKLTEKTHDLGHATPFFISTTPSPAVIPGSRLSKGKRNEENITLNKENAVRLLHFTQEKTDRHERQAKKKKSGTTGESVRQTHRNLRKNR